MLGWVLLLYAVVQGVTEFLPVSSSGHLELLGIIVGAPAEPLLLATWLHLATALAAVAYHRRTYRSLVRNVRRDGGARRFVVRCAAAQAVTGAVGTALLLALTQPAAYRWWLSAWLLGVMMLVNAAVLWTAPRGGRHEAGPLPELSWVQAMGVGLAQALAMVPGLSRQGLTMAAGMHLGLGRRAAADLSLLLAPLVMAAAAALWSARVWPEPLRWFATWESGLALFAMFAATFGLAMVTARWTVSWVEAGRLRWFAPWSAVLGLATLAWAIWS